ncbi:unnamed protein product [Lampetra planeri]
MEEGGARGVWDEGRGSCILPRGASMLILEEPSERLPVTASAAAAEAAAATTTAALSSSTVKELFSDSHRAPSSPVTDS